MQRAVYETAAVIQRCGLRPDQLAGLFLVGGSSRLPIVARLLHAQLGIAPTVLEQPELPVAEGALAELVPPVSSPAGPPVAVSTPPTSPAAPPPPAAVPPPVGPAAGRGGRGGGPGPPGAPPGGPAGRGLDAADLTGRAATPRGRAAPGRPARAALVPAPAHLGRGRCRGRARRDHHRGVLAAQPLPGGRVHAERRPGRPRPRRRNERDHRVHRRPG